MSSHLRTILQAPIERQRVRLTGTVGTATAGKRPFNTHASWGHYAEVWASSGCVWFRWAPVGSPPFSHTICAVDAGDAGHPRLAIDERGTLSIVYTTGGAVNLIRSTDDGLTWEGSPTVAFASGTYPTIALGVDGGILIGARVGGELQIRRRAPGDTALGTAFVAKDDAAVNIGLADDSFHFSAAPEGPGRWLLHCRYSGESTTSTWWSADDGATWKRFT